MAHFTISAILASLAREILAAKFFVQTISKFGNGNLGIPKPVQMSWSVFLKKVLPTGIISALDIGIKNWSLVFITVSLYTMIRSTQILWILLFSVLFGLEKPKFNLIFIILCISGGLLLSVYKSTQFHLEGFCLCCLACFLSGVRWTLTQLLCQKDNLGLNNPIEVVYHLMPTMLLGLYPIFLGRETDFLISEWTFNAPSPVIPNVLTTVLLISSGGIIAFFLSCAEFLLLTYSSSLTFAIAGIFKELITLLIATQAGSDQLSAVNWVGFVVCSGGIMVHIYNKYTDMATEALADNSNEKEEEVVSKDYWR